ncbi:MAG: ORF6C domain-containing protein [Saprospiraceae bacterium]|nr:ORF6C domain-containing protein [Saprospiraceae bacterium]
MNDEKALIPIKQRQVTFYEDEITAVLVKQDDKQQIYVPVKPICESLGIDWDAQRQRIRRDPVLSKVVKGAVIITAPSVKGLGGGPQEMLCLPLEFLNGWLFGINASRVKPELQEPVLRYQLECYKVLAEAFQEGRLTADPAFDELLQADTPAAQAYKMIVAMMQLARQQLLLEARLDSQSSSIEDHERRLEYVESQLGNASRTITEDEAVQISKAVKAIGLVWSQKEKKNQYGAVYGLFYSQFEITSYKLLPTRRFREAMNWLTQWYIELTGKSEIPF